MRNAYARAASILVLLLVVAVACKTPNEGADLQARDASGEHSESGGVEVSPECDVEPGSSADCACSCPGYDGYFGSSNPVCVGESSSDAILRCTMNCMASCPAPPDGWQPDVREVIEVDRGIPSDDVPVGDPLGDTSAIPCEELSALYVAQIAMFTGCVRDSDCTIVGGSGTCDCGYVLGMGSGDPVSLEGRDGANELLTRFWSDGCRLFREGTNCVWDAAPATNLRCEGSRCTATSASCLLSPN